MEALARTRLVVLGLDGLPYTLARSLSAQGVLPNLSKLALAPQSGAIRAELPELSPVNWTSFYTAAGPAEHGVFGFTALDPQSYELHIANAAWVRCPTIFQRLGEQGKSVRVVNLPNTYPAAPLPGMLVAGFVAPELSRAVFPPFLAPSLAAKGYKLEADTVRGKKDPEFLLSELRATLESRRQALDMLWPDLAWDLFVFVLTETDRLFHFLFPACTDANHPLHAACLEFLRHWDALIGDVLERYDSLPEPKRLVALADHGFCALKIEVNLNTWLEQQGLLRLTPVQDGLEAHELDAGRILPETKCFALDPGRIYLHARERFSRSAYGAGELHRLLEDVRQGLLHLTFEGEPVMQQVATRDALYPVEAEFRNAGIASYQPPDLLCTPNPGFDLKAKFDSRALFGLHGRHGTHTVGDAFFYDSVGARPERVRDVGRLVLDHFNGAAESTTDHIYDA